MTAQGIRGYTLIELLFATSLLALSSAFAFNTLNSLFQKAQQTSARRQMIELLSYARGEAISRGATMTFCASDDGQTCISGKAKHLIVFRDSDTNHTASPSEILRLESPSLKNSSYKISVSADREYVRFRPEGTAVEWGNITLCPESADQGAPTQVVINYGGRLRLAQDKDGDGVPEDRDGNPVVCL